METAVEIEITTVQKMRAEKGRTIFRHSQLPFANDAWSIGFSLLAVD